MAKPYLGNRNPRFVRIGRGGLLEDGPHQSLALWAASCAERVLPLFQESYPSVLGPSQALDATRIWAKDGMTMMEARSFAYAAHAAAREVEGVAREVARACGHAVATAHMADHELGAAFYALRAIQLAFPDQPEKVAAERAWQKEALTEDIRELVLDDMKQRASKFQHIFDDSLPMQEES